MNRADYIRSAKAKGWLLWRHPKAGKMVFACEHVGCQGVAVASEMDIKAGDVPHRCRRKHKKGFSYEAIKRYEALRDFLRHRRQALGLPQDDLEAVAGLSVDHVGKLEISDRLPQFPTLLIWADALGFDIALVPKGLPDQTINVISHRAGFRGLSTPLPPVLQAQEESADDQSPPWLQGIASAG